MRIKRIVERIKNLRVVVVPWWYFESSEGKLLLHEGYQFQYLHYLKSGDGRWIRKADLMNDDEKEHLLIKCSKDAGEFLVLIFERNEKGELSVSNQMVIDGGEYHFTLKPNEKLSIEANPFEEREAN